MKLSVGTLLAIVTLIGSILIGGANFGELRSQTRTNKSYNIESRIMLENRTNAVRSEMVNMSADLRKENLEVLRLVSEMNADIRWIKQILTNREKE